MQEDYELATEPVHHLGRRLIREGLWALLVILLVIFALWAFVLRVIGEPIGSIDVTAAPRTTSAPMYDMTTLPARKPD